MGEIELSCTRKSARAVSVCADRPNGCTTKAMQKIIAKKRQFEKRGMTNRAGVL
jgi:hypothetical protein